MLVDDVIQHSAVLKENGEFLPALMLVSSVDAIYQDMRGSVRLTRCRLPSRRGYRGRAFPIDIGTTDLKSLEDLVVEYEILLWQ
jgi:hypothetical protein